MLHKAAGSGSLVWTANRHGPGDKIHLEAGGRGEEQWRWTTSHLENGSKAEATQGSPAVVVHHLEKKEGKASHIYGHFFF